MRRKLLIVLLALGLCAAALTFAASTRSPLLPGPLPRSMSLGLVLLEQERGLYVLAIADPSPAGRSGLLAGDVLTHVAGEQLQTVMHLDALLERRDPPYPVTLFRGEQLLTLELIAE